MDFPKLYNILPKDPITWNTQDVTYWLDYIGLKQFSDNFRQATIDGACLLNLTEQDLMNDLGVQSGIMRKKILNWLQIGIKDYSRYLKGIQQGQGDFQQIAYSDFSENVFIKQSLETDFLNQSALQNTSQNNQGNYPNNIQFIECSDNINEITHPNVRFPQEFDFAQNRTRIEIEEPDNQGQMNIENVGGHILRPNQNIQNQISVNFQIQQHQPVKNSQQSGPKSGFTQVQNQNDFMKAGAVQEKQSSELIIQPSEGPQTNFFCIDESGGLIGRHSSSQILILEESISRKHAEITFNEGNFFITDIGSTTGTFIKINEQLPLKQNMIVELGSNQFQMIDLNYKTGELKMIVIEGPSIDKVYNLQFTDQKSVYNIGRKPNNEISLPDDHHLSNLHTRIYFYDHQFLIEDQSSTNGTWQRLSKENEKSEPFKLEDKTTFKIGTTLTYQCTKRNKKIVQIAQDLHATQCVICCENDRDAVYLPCKHNIGCMKCSKNLKQCPVCRRMITEHIKIYK